MPTPITASILYNLVACPNRVTMDAFADPPCLSQEPDAMDFILALLEQPSEGEHSKAVTVSGDFSRSGTPLMVPRQNRRCARVDPQQERRVKVADLCRTG